MTTKLLKNALLTTLLALILAACGKRQPEEVVYNHITIEQEDSLTLFYPQFRSIDLAFGPEVPADDSLLFCCAAAFTASCLDTFCHDNIRCAHVSHGIRYEGSEEPLCKGVFAFYNGQAYFGTADQPLLDSAAKHHGMGFQQILIMADDTVFHPDSLEFLFHKECVFRALCEKEGKLCLAQSNDTLPYPQFVHLLAKSGMSNAIYLDMGSWSHTQYRDNRNRLEILGKEPNPFATNWLIFKK